MSLWRPHPGCFVIRLPLTIIAWAMLHYLILNPLTHDTTDVFSGQFGWVLILSISTGTAAALDAAVLRLLFRRKVIWPFLWEAFIADLVCLALAGYATAQYAFQHPPEA